MTRKNDVPLYQLGRAINLIRAKAVSYIVLYYYCAKTSTYILLPIQYYSVTVVEIILRENEHSALTICNSAVLTNFKSRYISPGQNERISISTYRNDILTCPNSSKNARFVSEFK